MRVYLYAIIIFVVILVLYSFATWNTSAYEDYMYGFWVAEGDDFCEKSEIDSMLLFIGEPDAGLFTTSRTCYLIIMNNLCNQGLTLTYKTGWTGIGVGKYRVHADVEFDDEQIWDGPVTCEVDMKRGILKIKNRDGTVYAILTKQHDTTNYCKELEKYEMVDD